jgi:hypothetical protein
MAVAGGSAAANALKTSVIEPQETDGARQPSPSGYVPDRRQELFMNFRISGLQANLFAHLYGLSAGELLRFGATRHRVDARPGFPDRIEMRDCEPGETVLLLNHVHQPADNAYRASHAIFVREGALDTYDAVNEVPEVMRIRPLSLRAFDADHQMMDAELTDGRDAEAVIAALLVNPRAAYLQAHYAKRGCFAARIERA